MPSHTHEWADPYCQYCGTFKDSPDPQCTDHNGETRPSHSWTKVCMHCPTHTGG